MASASSGQNTGSEPGNPKPQQFTSVPPSGFAPPPPYLRPPAAQFPGNSSPAFRPAPVQPTGQMATTQVQHMTPGFSSLPPGAIPPPPFVGQPPSSSLTAPPTSVSGVPPPSTAQSPPLGSLLSRPMSGPQFTNPQRPGIPNQTPVAGPPLTAQQVPPPPAVSGSIPRAPFSQPPIQGQGQIPPKQSTIPGPFQMQPATGSAFRPGPPPTQQINASGIATGSIGAPMPPSVSGGIPVPPTNPTQVPPFPSGQMIPPMSQPPQMVPPMNQPPQSVSQRPPPTFGLPGNAPPGVVKPTGMLNTAPAPPTFSSQTGNQGLPPTMPTYPSAPGLQSAVQAPQFQQYQAQPSTALDGQARASYGYQQPYQGSMQALTEEFESLSMATVPGTMDPTIDPNELPRPAGPPEYPAQLSPANCHPRYFRLTTGSLPNSQSLASRWHLPLGAVVHPLAEAPVNEEVPVIDFGASGIVRCRRCRTYINPYAVFTDNGRRWRCNLCGLNNEVLSEYYCPLDHNGRRKDADERPELCQGSVEFIAPAEYMVRPPMPPVYFFLIDVSAAAVKNGMLQIAADTIKSCLDKLPGYPRTQIGFLTFDSTLHFYSLKSSLTQPQMMVVADLDDPFLPMPDDLLVNLSDSRSVVESLLNSLPSMFKDNTNVESALGPALRAVYMIMSQLGGKLLLFQSTLPSLGVGRLKIRGDDPRVYGSDKEASLRAPEDAFYKQMAAEFSKFQIGVDVFAFSENYIDLASLGTLAKYTAGQVYLYPAFQPHLSGEKLRYELTRDLTRETAWEAVLRIRCGKGLRFTTYHGHFLLRSSDLMALPAVDCDKTFAMQLALEETLLTAQTAYFQTALLYTSSNGERRIRIHTYAAPLTSDLNEMYRSADVGAIMTLLSRLAIEKSLTLKLDEVRQQFVQTKLANALREYQNMHSVHHHLTGRLIYPESLKLLPLYCLALYKSLALRGGYVGAGLDERVSTSFDMMLMSVPQLLNLLYPLMVRLDESLAKWKDVSDAKSLQWLPLTAMKLDPHGAFLINDGLRFVVWMGSILPADFSVQLLGVESARNSDLSKEPILEQSNDLSKRFMSLLKSLRSMYPSVYQQCILVRQGDQPREGFLVLFNLVEDRTAGSIGYADWMIQIYRQVKQKA